ncbi:MAG: helix-turn-helix transcriptional regulator [Gallionella sp.]
MQTLQNTNAQQIHTALIRRREVEKLTALSKSRIYALMMTGDFPKPVSLGAMSVAWLEVEIHEWIAQRVAVGRRELAASKAIVGGAK